MQKDYTDFVSGRTFILDVASVDDTEAIVIKSFNCTVSEVVGDWCRIVSDNTVQRLSDNTNGSILGVIKEKPTTTTCNVIVRGKAVLFTGLDTSKERYFLSITGGMTSTPPSANYVIELGKPLNATTLDVEFTNIMKRS